MSERIAAPFPYFGGKSLIADRVWAALGDVKHYIEPFFGSGAVLLARPDYDSTRHVETVCDADGFVANVWRALQFDPDEVARWCDWPVNHADLNARRRVLLFNEARLLENLHADAEWFDAKMAGYWIWAASCWIGAGLTRPNARSHISGIGQGVHASNPGGQIPHITNNGSGVHKIASDPIREWFAAIQARLRRVRVVCGDWTRVCGGNWQDGMGMCGAFFDPPYSAEAERCNAIYHAEDLTVAHAVREWAIPRGASDRYRIAIAGYDGEHNELTERHGWRVVEWSAKGGYGNQAKNGNRHMERLWLSPHCTAADSPRQIELVI